ncbi:MAG: hypothetical protein HFI87_01520 [Bacilli bacterium]|nr:hypothetical protein [Bacilli bacterium]
MGLIDKFKNMFTEEVEEEVVETKQSIKSERIEKEEPLKRSSEYQPKVTPTRINLSRTTTSLEDNDIIKKYTLDEPILQHEEKNIAPVEEKKILKREEKFVFPVYFDDKDFEKIEEKTKKVETKKMPEKKEIYGAKIEKKEEPKIFKPTPIISPIYGVLDKNYHKEDISSKKVTHSEYRDPSKPLTIDDVRKKAYGTLEDDLETSLFTKSSIFMEPDSAKEEKEESKNNLLTDLVDDNEYSSVDEFLNSPIEEYKAKHEQDDEVDNDFDLNNTLDNLELSINSTLDNIDGEKEKEDTSSLDDLIINSYDEDDHLVEDYIMNNNTRIEETKDDDDLTQSDLFNLIDSMYEKGDD